LNEPWFVSRVDLQGASVSGGELHIHLDFERGAHFLNSRGVSCGVHDTTERVWQHLNFFQHTCYLHARVPRLLDGETGKVETAAVSWARAGSGFSLLFEAFAMSLIEHGMPVNRVAETFGIEAARIWRFFNFYVERAVQADDLSGVRAIGVDETSRRKGHSYVTIVVDLESKRTVYVTLGKDSMTLERFAFELKRKGGQAENIAWASIDMSPAFISGIKQHFEAAQIVFDKFHLMKKVNEAIDQTRLWERKQHQDKAKLKGHKYTFLKNKSRLSSQKQQQLEELLHLFPQLAEAYRLRETLQLIWQMTDPAKAIESLQAWLQTAAQSQVQALQGVAKTFHDHWEGIVSYFQNRITNSILENTNLKIQAAKRRARGYRNTDNFINMIYFLTAKLDFYPHQTS
jgi:transposase